MNIKKRKKWHSMIQISTSCFRTNSTTSGSHAKGVDGGESQCKGERGGEVQSVEDSNQSAMGNSTGSG